MNPTACLRARCSRTTSDRRTEWTVVTILLAALVLAGCSTGGITIAQETRRIEGADGFPLDAYTLFEWKGGDLREAARSHVRSGVLVYVQGSEDRTVLSVTEHLAGACAMGLDVIAVERRGVDGEGNVDHDVAKRFCTKETRVGDECALIASYLATRSGTVRDQGPIILMGTSEGADVAASVAARTPDVTHLILVAGGGGWTQAEEFRHVVEQGTVRLPEVDSVDDLEQKFAEIRRSPDADREWFGHPYRRWASYLFERASDQLIALDIPILLIHGSADTSVPVESARALRDRFAAAGKTNLRYIEYANVDHSLKDTISGTTVRPLLEIDTVEWLAELGVLPESSARVFVERVRAAHPELRPGSDRIRRSA
jgi:pimeloyl-ACP methyl ester carboxylesterase